MDTTSYWSKSTALPRFKALDRDVKVDVLIIGAGITGVTTAYLMKRAGYKVALIERSRGGGFDTSNTTAHLTCVTDTRLNELVKKFGRDTAKAVWDSGYAAIDQIHKLIEEEEIACDFKWVPGYQHDALKKKDRVGEKSFHQDAELADELGFSAHFIEEVPLTGLCGVKYSHQALFNPLKYLAALLRRIPGKGSHVFEKTEAGELKPRTLELENGKIHYSYLVLATHTPLTGKTNLASATLFQSKLFLYTSYAIGAKIKAGFAPEASYWDVSNPYYYLRVERRRGFDYAILGGEDHKTGQLKNTEGAYARLETVLTKLIPSAKADARWSGQVLETPDGLPYIGETAEKQFAATGFSGNGMTFGTLGAMMALDALEKRKNPWQDLYAVHRKHVTTGVWHYLKENADYPYYMVRNWLGGAEGKSVATLKRNEGKILKLEGKKVAAYRGPDDKVSLCSPVCTHLGCIVNWNRAERTWDCPCHGSRFAPTGEVLTGPAETPLEKLKMADGKIVAVIKKPE